MNSNPSLYAGAISTGARAAYEAKVGIEAVERAGHMQPELLKGIVHEVLYCDSVSANPQNVLDGTHAVLSKSRTAIRDDVLLMNSGSVVGRAQLKDTVAGIDKTVKQVASGKYAGTRLMGTPETVAVYNNEIEQLSRSGVKITQQMKSTGISSQDTLRIAQQTVGGTLAPAAVASAALSSCGACAALSGGIAAVRSGVKLAGGEIDEDEFIENVIRETLVGGVSGAAGTATASLASAGVATALTAVAPGAPVAMAASALLPGAVAVGAAVLVASCISNLFDDIFWWC